MTRTFVSPVVKAGFDPNQPRDDIGRWVRLDILMASVTDPELAAVVMAHISKPKERMKLVAEFKSMGMSRETFAEAVNIANDPNRMVFGGVGRSGEVNLLGAMLYSKIHNKKEAVSILGQKVSSPQDLAAVTQVYRDPRFETFRMIHVKDGVVVGQNAYSSRSPSSVGIPKDMYTNAKQDAAALGADKVYFLHNHPSGNPVPSGADIAMTQYGAGQMGELFGGHVIINHTKSANIDETGSFQYFDIDNDTLNDFSKAEIPHAMLGESITSTEAVSRVALNMNKEGTLEDRAVTVLCNVKGQVKMIADHSVQLLEKSESKVYGAMRRAGRISGAAGLRFLVLPKSVSEPRVYRRLIENGMYTDVVTANGWSLRANMDINAGRDRIEMDDTKVVLREGFEKSYRSPVRKSGFDPNQPRGDDGRWIDVDLMKELAGYVTQSISRGERPSPARIAGVMSVVNRPEQRVYLIGKFSELGVPEEVLRDAAKFLRDAGESGLIYRTLTASTIKIEGGQLYAYRSIPVGSPPRWYVVTDAKEASQAGASVSNVISGRGKATPIEEFEAAEKVRIESEAEISRRRAEERRNAEQVDKRQQEKAIKAAVANPKFKEWFGNSKMVNPDGTPMIMWHSTTYNQQINTFKQDRSGLVFVAQNRDFTKNFGPNSIPLFVSAENPFDAANPLHLEKIRPFFSDADISESKEYWDAHDNYFEYDHDAERYFPRDPKEPIPAILQGEKKPTIERLFSSGKRYWGYIEQNEGVVDAIKRSGFDSFLAEESDDDGLFPTLALFSPSQIKHAYENSGDFDRDSTDVRKSFWPPITKSGFDPNQPRDANGRWIEIGRIRAAVHDTRAAARLIMSIGPNEKQRVNLAQALRREGMKYSDYKAASKLTKDGIPPDFDFYRPEHRFQDMDDKELREAFIESQWRETVLRDDPTIAGAKDEALKMERYIGQISDELANRSISDEQIIEWQAAAKDRVIEQWGGREEFIDQYKRSLNRLIESEFTSTRFDDWKTVNSRAEQLNEYQDVQQEVFASILSRKSEMTDNELNNVDSWLLRSSFSSAELGVEIQDELAVREKNARTEVRAMDLPEARNQIRKWFAEGNVQRAEAAAGSLDAEGRVDEYLSNLSIDGSNSNAVAFAAKSRELALKNESLARSLIGDYADFERTIDPAVVTESGEIIVSPSEVVEIKKDIAYSIATRLEVGDAEIQRFAQAFGVSQSSQDPLPVRAASHVVTQWARSSGDTEPQSVAIQYAVASRFDIDLSDVGGSDLATERTGKELYEGNKAFLDSVVEAIYQNTQERLAEAGVDEVVLYRGVTVRKEMAVRVDDEKAISVTDTIYGLGNSKKNRVSVPGEFEPIDATVADVDVDMNPLSSYSLTTKTAKNFASSHTGAQSGAIIVSHVRREDVFSTFATGLGCTNEEEFVIVGKPRKAKAIVSKSLYSLSNNNDFLDLIEKSGTSVNKAMKIEASVRLAVDYNLLNADWIKTESVDVDSSGRSVVPVLARHRMQPAKKSHRSTIAKRFDPNQPRDDNGRWVDTNMIRAAASDVAMAAQVLRGVTKPKQRALLAAAFKDAGMTESQFRSAVESAQDAPVTSVDVRRAGLMRREDIAAKHGFPSKMAKGKMLQLLTEKAEEHQQMLSRMPKPKGSMEDVVNLIRSQVFDPKSATLAELDRIEREGDIEALRELAHLYVADDTYDLSSLWPVDISPMVDTEEATCTDADEDKFQVYREWRDGLEAEFMSKVEKSLRGESIAKLNLSKEDQEFFRETMADALQSLTPKMMKRVMENVEEVIFYKDTLALGEHLYGEGRPVGGAWGRFAPGVTGDLHLDGNGKSGITAKHIYLHELAHVVDGVPKGEITFSGSRMLSDSGKWKDAWAKEIKLPHAPLSQYATTSPIEGFAEFGRLVMTDSSARERFPLAYKAWVEFGLIGEEKPWEVDWQARKSFRGDTQALPEIFSRSDEVVIGSQLFMVDILADTTRTHASLKRFVIPVQKAGFNPDQPRGDNGRWIRMAAIAEAAIDDQLAEDLRSIVTNPDERVKLNRAIDRFKKNVIDDGKESTWVKPRDLEADSLLPARPKPDRFKRQREVRDEIKRILDETPESEAEVIATPRVEEIVENIGWELQDLASVVGAPDDSTVHVEATYEGLHILVFHEDIDTMQRYVQTMDGRPIGKATESTPLQVSNENFKLIKGRGGKGFGAEVFTRQVARAHALGVKQIVTSAARLDDPENRMVGYVVWPRFGYNAPLKGLGRGLYERVKDRFPSAKTVLDVFSTVEGREWWAEHGSTVADSVFDLDSDSRSMQTLAGYHLYKRRVAQESGDWHEQ